VEVKVWKAPTGELERVLSGGRPEDHPLSAVFSADGEWLIVESVDAYRWWRAASWEAGRTIFRREMGADVPAACSPDGHMQAVCLTPYSVQLIDSASGREMASLAPSDPHSIKWLSFSPDSTFLAAATQDHIIQLWDLRCLRSELASVNLDWALPPYPPPGGQDRHAQDLHIRVLNGKSPEKSD
jgi:WD40 repeat protein